MAVRPQRPARRRLGGRVLTGVSEPLRGPHPLRALLPFVRPYRGKLVAGAACVLAGAGIAALGPLLVRGAIDALRSRASWSAVTGYAGAIVLVALAQGVFRYAQRRFVFDAARYVEADLRDALFGRLVRQPPGFFDEFPTGDILSRFGNDLGAVRMAAGPGIMFGVNTIATLALAVGFMVWLDPELALWALLPLPFVSIAVKLMGQRIHQRSEAAQAALADVSTAVLENLTGMRVVRAYGRGDAQQGAFERRSMTYVRANLRLARIQAALSPLLGFLLGLSLLLLLWLGGRRVAAGTLTLGDFVAFTMYVGMISWPLVAFGWIANLFQRAGASMRRLNRILLAEPAIADGAGPAAATAMEDAPAAGGAVAWRGVTFRYRPGRPAVLDNLTLEVPAGLTLGLTGPTGGGKTTLVSLLPRLYEPEAGVVELDGRPVGNYRLDALRGAVAMAPQEPFLFSETLRANLAFGAPDAEPDAAPSADAEPSRDGPAPLTIEMAAAIAGLEPDLAGFPAGLDTIVGERGITLSGGQKQRAALARALLADPRVLILDDAFSSVDTETEERILSRLRAVFAGRTTILISHRASTLRHAHRIVVLDGGRIVEDGTPDELLAQGGWYAALYRRQQLEAELERA